MANGTPVANPGWDDIQGIFAPFRSQMMWRLNLGDYDDVKANAQIILLRITHPGMIMPPPPYPPLTTAQVQTFRNWVSQGCPQTPTTTPPVSAAAPAAVSTGGPPTSTPGTGFRF
jgi:hypothetical protein